MDSILPGADKSEELENTASEEKSPPDVASEIDADATHDNDDTTTRAETSVESTDESSEPVAAEQDNPETAAAEAVAEPTAAAPVEESEAALAEDAPAAAPAEDPVAEVAEDDTVEATAVEAAEQAEALAEDAPSAEGDESEQKFEPLLKRGEIHDGTIIATSPTSVQVDVAGITEGVIPGRELERMNRETLDLLKVGEQIPVFVVNPHDHRGNVILSINRALEEMDWRQAEEYRANKSVYESRIAGYNKGGLIVRFGRVRGFVPQSQISADRRSGMEGETPEERWGGMVNEAIAVKVMEVDRDRNRLILSERAAAREMRENRKEDLIEDLELGEIRTGRVVSLVDFGAFINIGGAEGLVHLTELAWHHVTHAREVLKVGDEVKVEVISIDPDRKRIGLSMKRLMEDPWDTVAIEYNIGQLVQGKITKLTKFGAFAQLVDAPAIEGLIHISELSDDRVNHPREVVNEDETLTLRVVKMDIERRRLGLSLKAVNSAEYLDQDWDY